MTAKIRISTLACVMVLSFGGLASATPVIKDWSSKGGQTLNKTNAKDTMYLVQPGDKITFTIKADGAGKYEWMVNKKVNAKATGESFVWTVPDEKGIWEIHLKASDKEGQAHAHAEWVVSTLPKAEAPVIFDSFTDGRFQGSRNERDPWGRPLPNWKVVSKYSRDKYPHDAGKFFLDRPDWKSTQYRQIGTKSDVVNGTWRFRYRLTKGPRHAYVHFYPVMNQKGVGTHLYWHVDNHRWFNRPNGQIAYRTVSWCGSMSGIYHGHKWHDVIITRSQDGYWRLWIDGVFLHGSLENDDLNNEELLEKYGGFVGLMLGRIEQESTCRMLIDGIEVYKENRLLPVKISFGDYKYYYSTIRKPDIRKGITIDGLGVTLKDIADAINNPSIFKYDAKTKTAICFTDLNIKGGAELIVRDETLKLHSKTAGERVIRVNNGAAIIFQNATITSTNTHHYQWAFTSEYLPDFTWNPSKRSDGSADYNFKGIFIAKNSTIDNCGFMYIVGPNTMVLENTKLTNIVSLIGGKEATGDGERFVKRSGRTHAVTFRLKTAMHRFNIKNCVFQAKNKDTAILFLGGDVVSNPTVIYDTRIENMKVIASDVSRLAPATNPKNPTLSCTLDLVNCKFGETEAVEPVSGASARIAVKYYLDVRAPVGAVVKVSNDSDPNYPPVNIFEKQVFTVARDEGYLYKCNSNCRYLKWVRGEKLKSTTVGRNGRTPLPSDRKHTIVLTDFVQDKSGKKEFTYTITVEKDGKKKVITGVNPGPEWYRADPDKPTYTITAVLDGKTVTEAELKKGSK